jgi:hypothetical protein
MTMRGAHTVLYSKDADADRAFSVTCWSSHSWMPATGG